MTPMLNKLDLRGSKLVGLTVVLCIVAGCSKPKETAAAVELSETAKIWTEATLVLSKVTDKQTADEARPKMVELAGRMRKVIEDKAKREEEAQKAGKRPPTLSDAQTKMAADATEKFTKEQQRVRQLEGGQQLLNDFYAALAPSTKQ
jgi:hypothetical protein